MQSIHFLQDEIFLKKTIRTLKWLQQSIQRGQNGSAASFSLLEGWALPYPETTGYIIETLFNYHKELDDSHLLDLAIHCTDWLCTLQKTDGAFPGGLGINNPPQIFDTGQIIFGLTHSFIITNELKYKIALKNATQWLLQQLESNGSWQKFAYQKGYVPAYYTRVIWAILFANTILLEDAIEKKMRQALQYYTLKINTNHTVQDWAFSKGLPAPTHTVAYTLEGMLESAVLLNDKEIIHKVIKIADHIVQLYSKSGKLAGTYDETWQGDYTFVCVTGNAQLSVFFTRLYEITGVLNYLQIAISIFESIIDTQWTLPLRGIQGGIPGSEPIWGAYQRFRFPNWAAKFYLDAYLLLKQNAIIAK